METSLAMYVNNVWHVTLIATERGSKPWSISKETGLWSIQAKEENWATKVVSISNSSMKFLFSGQPKNVLKKGYLFFFLQFSNKASTWLTILRTVCDNEMSLHV